MSDDQLIGNGVLEAYNLCIGFVPCMVAKAVCELGIPEILAAHPHDEPMSALRIVQLLSPPPSRPLREAAQQLDRMMRCLCAYNVFKAHVNTAPSDSNLEQRLSPSEFDPQAAEYISYSSTPVSKCLASLQPLLMLLMSLQMQAPWHHLSQSLLHGFAPFTATHSMDVWALAASDPSFGRLVNSAMACDSHISLLAFLNHYDGFQNDNILSLVDVGGGVGVAASVIASRYTSMKVINFDLPVIIDTAPIHPGVQHISGDMFKSIPSADSILLKWVLHDWSDEDCIKILDNCHKVLPKHGKLIIMEAVLDFPSVESNPTFGNVRFASDMVMLAHTNSGFERTKKQWEVLLGASKFTLCRIIDLPFIQSILEATPL